MRDGEADLTGLAKRGRFAKVSELYGNSICESRSTLCPLTPLPFVVYRLVRGLAVDEQEKEERKEKSAPQRIRKVKMTQKSETIPPCLIFIDKEGRWYHNGAEMIHREFIRLFYQNMELDSEGRHLINWADTRCYVDVEDTAFVVMRVSYEEEGQVQATGFQLSLSDDTKEALAPDTLFVGRDNVLYCRVKSGTFPARFNRASYYQLAEHIEEEDGAYFLPLNGRRYPIRKGDV